MKTKVEQAEDLRQWMQTKYIEHVEKNITDYLEEKGILYHLHPGPFVNQFKRPSFLTLMHVPNKLFHKVIVPGLRDICKKHKLLFRAEGYIKDAPEYEGTCIFVARIRVPIEDMSIIELANWTGIRIDSGEI